MHNYDTIIVMITISLLYLISIRNKCIDAERGENCVYSKLCLCMIYTVRPAIGCKVLSINYAFIPK